MKSKNIWRKIEKARNEAKEDDAALTVMFKKRRKEEGIEAS